MRALFLLFFLASLPACSGTVGDLFGVFPADVFQPEDPGGGDPGIPPGGGGFTATEIGFLEAAQGVTGDVRNIALAQVGVLSVAFLTAGTDGVHMVDVTQPELVNSSDFITTIHDSVLTAPAAIAGGRVDALAVVDNTYLICVAVGSGAPNAVSVFHIPTLIGLATSPVADLSAAFVPKTLGPDIAVPGVAGKGGGVSGQGGAFAVATGGAELGLAVIVPGTPGTWTSGTAFVSAAAPKVDNFVDVLFTLNGVFASVKSDATFGVISLALTGSAPPALTAITPGAVDVEDPARGGNFDSLINSPTTVPGPGNYPMDLTLDVFSLLVTGDDQIRIFNVTNPALTTPPSVLDGTGDGTISVDGSGGFFAVGARDVVRVYTSLGGAPQLVAQVLFTTANLRIRGVALTSSAAGRFVLACGGTRGLRIIQWSDTP